MVSPSTRLGSSSSDPLGAEARLVPFWQRTRSVARLPTVRDIEAREVMRRPGQGDRSPWSPVRFTAGVMVMVCLGLGLVLAQMTDTASSTSDTTATLDEPRLSGAAAPDAPETEVLGAVETPTGGVTPAPVDHLVIVTVAVTTCGERASGTGVLVAQDTVLTAAHTVGDAGLVRLSYGSQLFTGEVVGVFADGRDLAVIRLPAPMPEPIGAAAIPTDGSMITIAGFPEGAAQASVAGPVVAVPGLAEQLFTGPLAAVEATTQAGMSGGPAVDAAGNLVGLLVAAQPGTGTAVIATIDDVAAALEAPLIDGRCPETA